MNATLLILAAGLGSRFGGDKQISNVGPNGEMLMEYSIYDAIKAGFTKVVFILKEEMIPTVKENIGRKIEKLVEVEYAVQDFTKVPEWYTVPENREKPFGTTHAVLCAKEYLTEPFATINADDYYGSKSYEIMYDCLKKIDGANEAAIVPYILKNTVSENGAVTRGVCKTENGLLIRVEETGGIEPKDGKIVCPNGELDPDAEVSMNFWGFNCETLERMNKYFEDFLKSITPEQIKAECLLPAMVGELLESGELKVISTPSDDKWFGMTYKADKEDVENKLKALHADGTYPEKLF